MPVAFLALADDRAVEHIQRREQRGRAIALVIVGHGAGAALLHRQPGLGAVERLDLALLVHRIHQRLVRRVQIKADHVGYLLRQLGVVRDLEGGNKVRLQSMFGPNPLHAAVADAHRLGHRAKAPMGRLRRLVAQRLRQHQRYHLAAQGRLAGTPRPVPQQAIDARREVTLLPSPHRRLALADPAHDFHGPQTFPGQKHDPRAPDMLLRRIPVRNQPLEPASVARRYPNTGVCPHARRIAYQNQLGNPLNGAEH